MSIINATIQDVARQVRFFFLSSMAFHFGSNLSNGIQTVSRLNEIMVRSHYNVGILNNVFYTVCYTWLFLLLLHNFRIILPLRLDKLKVLVFLNLFFKLFFFRLAYMILRFKKCILKWF